MKAALVVVALGATKDAICDVELALQEDQLCEDQLLLEHARLHLRNARQVLELVVAQPSASPLTQSLAGKSEEKRNGASSDAAVPKVILVDHRTGGQ